MFIDEKGSNKGYAFSQKIMKFQFIASPIVILLFLVLSLFFPNLEAKNALYALVGLIILVFIPITISIYYSIEQWIEVNTTLVEENKKLNKENKEITSKLEKLIVAINKQESNNKEVEKSMRCMEKICNEIKEDISDRISSLVVSFTNNEEYKKKSIQYLRAIKAKMKKENIIGGSIYSLSNYMSYTGTDKLDDNREEVIRNIMPIVTEKNMKFKFLVSVKQDYSYRKDKEFLPNLIESIAKEINIRLSIIYNNVKGTEQERHGFMEIVICDNAYYDVLLIEEHSFVHFNYSDKEQQRQGFMIQDKSSYAIMKHKFEDAWEASKGNNHMLKISIVNAIKKSRLYYAGYENLYKFP